MVLPVLPLLALSGYVTIDGVSADAVANKVTVAVTTSAAVGADDIRGKLTGGVLQLYLDEGHVHEGRRSFKSAGLAINVVKRTDYAKVEVPLAAELGCAGPVSLEPVDKGFTASIACKGAAVTEAVEEKAAKPIPAAPATQPANTTAPAAAPKNTTAPAAAPTSTTTESAPALKPAAPVNTVAPAAPIAASSHGSAMMLPLLLLVGLGAGAFFLKKRQQQKSTMIQILETAQLGPKRQLVVARVNGETMILGSSEAGITCLTGTFRVPTEGTMSSFPAMPQMVMAQTQAAALAQMVAPAAAPAPVAPQFVPFEPAPAAPQSSGNEFVDEGGLLTRLFRARGQEKPVEKFENIELHEFDNLLQESIADQELRRKLSSGLRGKVS